MSDTRVDAPKMFREMDGVELTGVTIPDAQETLWSCRGVKLRDVEVKNADYLLQHSADIDIDRYRQQGNYSFQYCKNVVIRNAVIDSKDAFWETDNVTIYDSELTGEYLGWHSKTFVWYAAKSMAPSRSATAATLRWRTASSARNATWLSRTPT